MSNILIYQTEDGSTKIQVQFTDNTVWLTQADMVKLFQSSKSNISEHIRHIFEGGIARRFSCSEFPNNCQRW